ncbi:murein L,D-transpeptidase [Flavobacterium sp.]|jgi:murein L,D-transpeptidase YcbB/YkuD|uniref:murein L,D-transpeptidase n=1 Tax=Flavobacterium sp. TaxID=239 RepID=UPI0037C02ED4
MKKLFFLFLLFLLASCAKEAKIKPFQKKILKDKEHNVLIRPVAPDLLNDSSDSVRLYYKKMDFHEIWYLDENRKDLLSEIQKCSNDGLQPEEYSYETLKKLEENRKNLSEEEQIVYDILLTQSFEKLALHLHSGKLNPKKLYANWDIKPKKIALSHYLLKAIKERKVSTTFKELKPNHLVYQLLKKSLVALDAFPDVPFSTISSSKNKIQLNDTLPELVKIKKRLAYWNDYSTSDSIISWVYDSITYKAVKKFQKRHGLQPDGVIGKGTIYALNFTKSERKAQILANLERWRWYPKDLGDQYLIVNLPEFSLNYVSHEDTIATHKVIVGTAKRSTPILSSKLSNFVFNPTWTIPPTIIKEDLQPNAATNSNYFAARKLIIYDAKGNKVSPKQWNPNKATNYRYVQEPGYNNSLGLVKFNFPNHHLVYLHDTNHRSYFLKTNRALSSGCVRVENPLELAALILNQDYPKRNAKEWIASLIKNKKTKSISVKSTIPIYLFYWTSWIEGTQLQFRPDIYLLDKELAEKLRQ